VTTTTREIVLWVVWVVLGYIVVVIPDDATVGAEHAIVSVVTIVVFAQMDVVPVVRGRDVFGDGHVISSVAEEDVWGASLLVVVEVSAFLVEVDNVVGFH
jgi:hypothetical protein